MSYFEVASSGSKSPHDDIGPLHASVRTEAKAHPACSVDYQFECNVPLQIIKAPHQTDQMVLVQVLHKGHCRFHRPCYFCPSKEHGEERKQRAHDVSFKLEILKLSSLSAKSPNTLPTSPNTPASLDEPK